MAVTPDLIQQNAQKYLGRPLSAAELQTQMDAAKYENPQQFQSRVDTHFANVAPPQAPGGGGGGEGDTGGFSFEFPAFPGLSPEEKALIASQQQLVQLQIGDLSRQSELNAALFPLQKQLSTAQLQFAADLFPQQKAMIQQLIQESQPSATQQEIQRLGDERALASLRGEPIPLSPQQTAQLDTIFNEQRRTGQQGIRQFAEEMAAGRGLRLSDTPIGDVALREAQNLESSLGAQRASAELGLQQSQQGFTEGVRQFQTGLQQQAFQNRLALAAGASNQPQTQALNTAPLISSLSGTLGSLASDRSAQAQYALGAAGIGIQGQQLALSAQQLRQQENQANLDRLSRERIAGLQFGPKPTVSPTTGQQIAAYAPAIAGLVNAGATLYGSGAFGGGGGYSTARVKKDITPLDPAEFKSAAEAKGLPLDGYDESLAALRATPITRWRYKWESERGLPHIGPILELAPPELSRDGLRISLLDYAGLQHAGLKALDRKVSRLEAERD